MSKSRDDATHEARARGRRRAGRGRGRRTIAALLLTFVLVASAVIWRRSYGLMQARRLAELDRTITQLEGTRAELAGRIRDESSRERLAPALARLGMRVPDDSQVRIVRR